MNSTKKEKPLVSFIIPTRNRSEMLEKTLECIEDQNYPEKEVMIIDDNPDSTETKKMIEEKFPHVKYIRLPNKAHGPAKAINIGVENTEGEIIAQLDDDVEIGPDWTQKLLNKLEELPDEVALIQPKIIEDNNHIKWSKEGYTDRFQGCGILYKRKLFEEVGYLDPDMFYVVHEEDLGARLLSNGYKIYVYPEVEIRHKSSWAPDTPLTSEKTYYLTRNHLWYIWRYFNFPKLLTSTAYVTVFNGKKALEDGQITSYIKGVFDAFLHLPENIIKRRNPRPELHHGKPPKKP